MTVKTQGGKVILKNGKVSCSCCCPYPPVCLEGSYPNDKWTGDGIYCQTPFFDIAGCADDAPPILAKDPSFKPLCGGITDWVLVISGSGGGCLGNFLTNFYCKDDGVDSPIGTYSGFNFGSDPLQFLTFTVTEKQGETC